MAGTVRRNKFGGEEEAKRACFFKDGDNNFSGINVSITKNKYRSFESLLDDLSYKVPLPFGVRSIQTPSGAHFVHNLKEIKHGKNYVCSTFYRKPIHKIDYVGIASRRPWDISKPKTRDKRLAVGKRLAVDDFDVLYRGKDIKPKAITIVAKEDSRNRAKIVLSKKTALTYNSVLQTISNILQLNSGAVKDLYTVEGKKISSLADLINGPDVFVAVGRSGGQVNTKDVPKSLLTQRKRLQSDSTSRPSPPSPPKSPRKRPPRPNYSVYLQSVEKKSGGRKKPKSKKREDTWIITVRTADEESAGTEGQVTIQVYGTNGKSEEHVLSNSSTKQFESGTCDEFELKLPPIGEIFKIRLQLDGVTNLEGWLLKEVLMTNINTNQEISFSCNEWIKPSDLSTTAAKELPAIKPEKELFPVLDYEVSVYTGDVLAAGTDSRIYVMLFGKQGDTGRRYLNPNEENEFPFERGNVDNFHIEAVSLGSLTHLIVGHDNSGESPGWFLDKVIIGETGTHTSYTFPCRKWLDKDEDDGEIERVLFPSVLSDTIVTKEELWETYGWKVNNASQVSLVSVVTEKHLRMVRKKDEIRADADKDQAAVFTVSEGDDMEVRIFSALKQGVRHLTLDQDKIFTSTGKSGLLSEFYVHWERNGNMVLESVVHSGQYIVVKPNGTLTTGPREDGMARELRIHAKGTLRDKGRIRIRVRKNGNTVVAKYDQLYSDGDYLDEEGEFCVIKVDEKIRAFKNAVTDKFININSEEIACQGTDHDDIACKFIVHRNKVEGYVQLESLKMPGVYLGVTGHGKVKHAVDAGDEVTKLCLEVISYGSSKVRDPPPELESSESESEEEFVNNEDSDEEFKDEEDREIQFLATSRVRSEEETIAFANSNNEKQESSRQDGDKIGSVNQSFRQSPASTGTGKVHTPTPPKTPRDSSVPRRTPRVQTPVASRSPSVASVLSAASSVSLPESPGSGKNSVSSRYSIDENNNIAEDDQNKDEAMIAKDTHCNNGLTIPGKDTEPLESVISEGYSNEEKEIENQETELDIDGLKCRKTSNVSRNSNESKLEEGYYDNDEFEKDEEKDDTHACIEYTANEGRQIEELTQQGNYQSDQGPTGEEVQTGSPAASERLEAPSPEDSLETEEAYGYQDSLDGNASIDKVDSRREKEYLDLERTQGKNANNNEGGDETQSFTNEIERENVEVSIPENCTNEFKTCEDVIKGSTGELDNQRTPSLSINGSNEVEDITKTTELDKSMDGENIVISEDKDASMKNDLDELAGEEQYLVEKVKGSAEDSEDDSGISIVKSNDGESDQQTNDFNEDENMDYFYKASQRGTLTDDCKVPCTEDCKENAEHKIPIIGFNENPHDAEKTNQDPVCDDLDVLYIEPNKNEMTKNLPDLDMSMEEDVSMGSQQHQITNDMKEGIICNEPENTADAVIIDSKHNDLEENEEYMNNDFSDVSYEEQDIEKEQHEEKFAESVNEQDDLEENQQQSASKEVKVFSTEQDNDKKKLEEESADCVTNQGGLEDNKQQQMDQQMTDTLKGHNDYQQQYQQENTNSVDRQDDPKEDLKESHNNKTQDISLERHNEKNNFESARAVGKAEKADVQENHGQSTHHQIQNVSTKQDHDKGEQEHEHPSSAAEQNHMEENPEHTTDQEIEDTSTEHDTHQKQHEHERAGSTAELNDMEENQQTTDKEREDTTTEQDHDQGEQEHERPGSTAERNNMEENPEHTTDQEIEDTSTEHDTHQKQHEHERAGSTAELNDMEENQQTTDKEREDTTTEQDHDQGEQEHERPGSTAERNNMEENQEHTTDQEIEDTSTEHDTHQKQDKQERAGSIAELNDMKENQQTTDKEMEDTTTEQDHDQGEQEHERPGSTAERNNMEENQKRTTEQEKEDTSTEHDTDQKQDKQERAGSTAELNNMEENQEHTTDQEIEDTSTEHDTHQKQHEHERAGSTAELNDMEENQDQSTTEKDHDQGEQEHDRPGSTAERNNMEENQKRTTDQEKEDTSTEHDTDQKQDKQERAGSTAELNNMEENQEHTTDQEIEDTSTEHDTHQKQHEHERAGSTAELNDMEENQDQSTTEKYHDQGEQEHDRPGSTAERNNMEENQEHTTDQEKEDTSTEHDTDQKQDKQERAGSTAERNNMEENQEHTTDQEIEDTSTEHDTHQKQDKQERAGSIAELNDMKENQDQYTTVQDHDQGEQEHERPGSTAERNNMEENQEHTTDQEIEDTSTEHDTHQKQNEQERTGSTAELNDMEENQDQSTTVQDHDQGEQEHDRPGSTAERNNMEESQERTTEQEKEDTSTEHDTDKKQHEHECAGSTAELNNTEENHDQSTDQQIQETSTEQDHDQGEQEHDRPGSTTEHNDMQESQQQTTVKEIKDNPTAQDRDKGEHEQERAGSTAEQNDIEESQEQSADQQITEASTEQDHDQGEPKHERASSAAEQNLLEKKQQKIIDQEMEDRFAEQDKDQGSSPKRDNSNLEKIRDSHFSDTDTSKHKEKNNSDEENKNLHTGNDEIFPDGEKHDDLVENESCKNNNGVEDKEYIDIECTEEQNLHKNKQEEVDKKDSVSVGSKNSDNEEEIEWVVETSTGEEQQKQYKGNIFVTFYGKIKKSKDILLKNEEKSSFLPREVDHFKVPVPQIGIIYKIRLSLQDEEQDTWWLEKVRLSRQGEEDMVCEWNLNKALSLTHSDYDQAVELPINSSNREPLPVLRYHVTFITGSQEKDYRDSKIHICLFGEIGDSGIRRLKETTSKEPKFMSNQTDIFIINAVYLGKITKILIGHDGTAKDWALSKIIVKEYEDANSAFVFNCTRPLETRDGSLETELIFSEIEGDHPKLLDAGKPYIR